MKIGSPLPRKKARIEIIPLIDIMFFLLAAFLLASLSMIRLQSVVRDLPSAKTAKPDFRPDILILGVGKGGEIYVEKTQVTIVELQMALSNKLRFNTNMPVYISADKEAKHGTVVRVLDLVRRQGIEKVSFAISPAAAAVPTP